MSEKVSDNADLVQMYQSPPLSQIVRFMNQTNDNFYAEMVLKTLGLEVKEDGTSNGGINVIHEYMQSLGITSGFDIMDGSGLSRYNQMSAEQLTSLLTAVSHEPTFDSFYDSLSIAGENGVLQDDMLGTVAEHHLRGLTGSMPYSRPLSGYVETADGERLAYSILTNGYSNESLTKLVNQFGAKLADYSRHE